MRLARVRTPDGIALTSRSGDTFEVIAYETDHPNADALVEVLHSGGALQPSGSTFDRSEVQVLAPLRAPSKFFGVGLNYKRHAAESGMKLPDTPALFVKTPNTIIGPTDPIALGADGCSEVDFEVELAIVIGACIGPGDAISARDALLGMTVCNDITARDAQAGDVQWVRSKSFDTFCPLGPEIVTTDEVDWRELVLRSTLSGEQMQEESAADMIFGPEELVTYISRFITLLPGDIITSGTPAGVGFTRRPPRFLQVGDTISVEIDGIGSCVNEVVAR